MLNICVFQGRLTADPELKTTANGTSVTSFSIAVDRDYTDEGGNRPTDFIRIQAWKGTAEFICNYFNKGDLISLRGELHNRRWLDKQGNKHTVDEVIAERVHFCGGKRKTADNDIPLPDEAPPERIDIENINVLNDDDLPF